jgi:VWFA-related protein
LRGVAGALCAAALLASPGARERRSSARAQDAAGGGAATVAVTLSAVDKEGRPFEGLRPEDLRVTADGAGQKVLSLARRADEPLRVVVMLDASASQERILPAARREAAEFLAALLRAGRDDAAVVSFTDVASVVEGPTDDLGALRRAAQSVRFFPPPGYVAGGVIVGPPPRGPALPGSTALWDSLASVCDKLFAGAKGGAGRRMIVLVTDGVDTSSRAGDDRAVERLLRAGVAVYSVGLGDGERFDGVERGALRKLSERTGGRALFPRNEGGLPEAFARVRGEALSTYVLRFAPEGLKPGGGRARRLRVEVVNPELRRLGVALAYPQSLFDPAPPAASR